MNTTFEKVSVHGGHSGAYCGHASDTLPEVVARYAAENYRWVCLTEHMPTQDPNLLPPEEAQAGMHPGDLQTRFKAYFSEARELQKQYRGQMEILVGFETEAYTGYVEEVQTLIETFEPDMLVGSVHHVNDILFDASPEHYAAAVAACGGVEAMYCTYFDKQLELINQFEPAVVGHFDLIRIYDPDYMSRWEVPAIRNRCLRNLDRIKALDLILDVNTRAMKKGAVEPYVSQPWMEYAIANGIPMALGDDSHSVDSVAGYLDEAVAVLLTRGGTPSWSKPTIGRHLIADQAASDKGAR